MAPMQFLTSIIISARPALIGLLAVSLLVAFMALRRQQSSRSIVIAALGVLLLINALVAYNAHYAFFSNVTLFQHSEWASPSAKLLLWPFAITVVFLVLNILALCYFIRSKKAKAFYLGDL
jgi:hypothetical protein